MAQRDPFGRLPDENPLAGLGTLSDGSESMASAEPVVAAGATSSPQQVAPAKPVSAEEARRSAEAASDERTLADAIRATGTYVGVDPTKVVNAVGRSVKVAFVVTVLIVIVGIASSALIAGKSITDRVKTLPSPGNVVEDTSSQGVRDARSLLVSRNLAPALRRLRASRLGQLRSMSIRPERIDAQLLTRGGRSRSVQVSANGELSKLPLASSGGGRRATIAFSQVDTTAPSRLLASAAARLKRRANPNDFVVLISFDNKPLWSAFMHGDKQFLADAHGRITSRVP